jgi:hypothetical protein
VDTTALATLDIRIGDLGGGTPGLASGHTVPLDSNAAGWGWFVDPTPGQDSASIHNGHQGEEHRTGLLTVREPEVDHLLGKEHEAGGVRQGALAAGVRVVPGSGPDWLGAVDLVFADDLFAGPEPRRHHR